MSYQAINQLAHLERKYRDCPDLAEALKALDFKSANFDAEVDLLAAALCQGRELSGYFDQYGLMAAQLFIGGVIAAYARYASDAPVTPRP